jgi:peptidoglycan hydrolase CwlO-like protein
MNISLRKKHVSDLKFCRDLLLAEREKKEKKQSDLTERIEFDYTLTEKQFDRFSKKLDKLNEECTALTNGIRSLTEEIKQYQYQIRIEESE